MTSRIRHPAAAATVAGSFVSLPQYLIIKVLVLYIPLCRYRAHIRSLIEKGKDEGYPRDGPTRVRN